MKKVLYDQVVEDLTTVIHRVSEKEQVTPDEIKALADATRSLTEFRVLDF